MHCLTDSLLILYGRSEHLCSIMTYHIGGMSDNLCVRGACYSYLNDNHIIQQPLVRAS